MSQNFTVDWVGSRTSGPDKHGNLIYTVSLTEYDAAQTVKMAKKSAPQVGDQVYGGIKVYENKTDEGEEYETHRFYSESNPDFRKVDSRPITQNEDRNNAPKGDEFWAQKDARLGRAGVLQAVVASGIVERRASINEYVAAVNQYTDALLASLEEKAPSPNQLPASTEEQREPTAPDTEAEAGGSDSAPAPVSPLTDDDNVPF